MSNDNEASVTPLTVEHLRRLHIEPGDVLVVRTEHYVSGVQAEWIRNTLAAHVHAPVIVLDKGMSLDIVHNESPGTSSPPTPAAGNNALCVNLGPGGMAVEGKPAVEVDGVRVQCNGLDISAHVGEANVAVLHMIAPTLQLNVEAEVQRRVTDVLTRGGSYMKECTERRLAQNARLQWLRDYDVSRAAWAQLRGIVK